MCVCVCVCIYMCVYLITPMFMHAFARASVCADAICFRVHNGDNDDDDINKDDDNENVESNEKSKCGYRKFHSIFILVMFLPGLVRRHP